MAIYSMTGFANAMQECGTQCIHLELRAVNHRYLDIQFRMPEDLRYLENTLRENITKHIVRGKLECRIQVQNIAQNSPTLNINQNLVGQLADLNKQWRKRYPDLGKLNIADILIFPGALSHQVENTEALAQTVQALLDKALNDFNASRIREGSKLAQHLTVRLKEMEKAINNLSNVFPTLLTAHMEKIKSRLQDAVNHVDNERLQQEFAIFIQKSDVDEEFSRLRTHIDEVRRIINSPQSNTGKRLDFLMQELNREANTLGSKAIATQCTQTSVELKVLIEQMREQVQNIE